ncbi:MAG: RND transporter [Candidatus Rokubacteria bacterium 13_2_20CM_69_15_1]|nr:MAG: RND transporter [Candidatus Rokubacteria bacterium 13_2_20CM_69_15_1]
MWIVRLALSRPYTFVVMGLVILLLGVFAIVTTPTDIFPEIDIPVVSVIWNYDGLTTEDMASRITTFSEYTISSAVNDVRSIESQTYPGVGVIKIYFQPNVNVEGALAQVTAVSQTILRRMPPGAVPPFILQYNASSVPIIQLALGGKTLSEAELYDYGIYRVRQQIAPIQGITLPLPYGGKPRQVMVDLDPQALLAKSISAGDVSIAVGLQNLTLPSGSVKLGTREYRVSLNSSPDAVATLNDLPVKVVNGVTVYLRDVAHVRDGFAVQTNMVRQDGRRSVLLTVIKKGGASTLTIVKQLKELLPTIRAAAPPGLEVKELFDQSLFVRAAITGVLTEGAIAAFLTGVMILLFLGSWRSTLVVITSIPLSILTSLAILSAIGQTLNVMTLGGLALAVGILVDDATVEIENIHRNLGLGKRLVQAILDGAQQIATPAFVSTLSICIVFVPVVFLTGPAKYLFTPLAMAVVFAMLASYVLSRTIVPTLVRYLLASEAHGPVDAGAAPSVFRWLHDGFQRRFERLRTAYVGALENALARRRRVFGAFAVIAVSGAVLLPFIGRDFFPTVDTGQFRLHVRAPAGTRIEETEQVFADVEAAIRRLIPKDQVQLVIDNIGQPQPINLAFTDSVTLGPSDGEILVSLNPERHQSTEHWMKTLRETLPRDFPGVTFFFQPADIVSQILNFGLPAPIDVQVTGFNQQATHEIALEVAARMARIPGAADVHLHQVVNTPSLLVNVDRSRAAELGLTQRDVANTMLVTLSSSAVVAPNYWSDPRNGINYIVAVQTPQSRVDSVNTLMNTSVTPGTAGPPQLLSNLATLERREVPAVISHSNVQPVFDVYANVQDSDLGSVATAVQQIAAELRPKLPPGHTIAVRGQVESMNSAFLRLGLGLIFAVLLVYLLMVVNFQSWLDPFIIITALPAGFCGIVWMLFVTHTTFSVPALMGAIMSVGVATANSILVVTFANDQMLEGHDSRTAALAAGATRLRPVLMTALAMVLGMLPMSLGLGEGGEQNAPLGRAVIGGLLVATFATLFLVPLVYSVLRRRPPREDFLTDPAPDHGAPTTSTQESSNA